MHRESRRLMEYFRDTYLQELKGATILDVGSRRIRKGTRYSYRRIFEPDYVYTGMDIQKGRNVDILGYRRLGRNVYDVVISGQTMEHVSQPWEWLKVLTQHFSKYICIIAPHTWEEHRYPIDTYRYMPDGMADLFNYAGIKIVEIIKDKKDTMGIGTKL